jgi:hypothetical protein
VIAADRPPSSYAAAEVDRFVADRGVLFPADYQTALVDDIAREITVAFQNVVIFHQGETPPDPRAVLRISGTITRFEPGSKAKRVLVGFGAGAATLQAQVRFGDAATGQVLLITAVRGTTWTALPAPGSHQPTDNLAKKIVKLTKANHLFE